MKIIRDRCADEWIQYIIQIEAFYMFYNILEIAWFAYVKLFVEIRAFLGY